MAESAEQLLRESQSRFCKGCGCIDLVFSIRILAKTAREFTTPLYLALVDLQNAYDSVNSDSLWMVLTEAFHLPSKLVRVLHALHQGTRGAVRVYGNVSEE